MWRKLLNKLVPQSARKGVFEPFVCEQYTHRVGAACLELKAMSDQPVQLMDSGDDTGFGVWGSSLVLANLLENDAVQRQRLDNATVIELGSGTGLVGLACAALAAKTVVLTGETVFLRHFCIKVIILPRQARDRHRENSKKMPFSQVLLRSAAGQRHTPAQRDHRAH